MPSYDTYTIILSNNNTLTNPTPGFPSANWIYTSPVNYTLSRCRVTNANLTNQNFGVYNGSRISGKVINDNGYNGASANANDGILNAAESGHLPASRCELANNTGGYDSTIRQPRAAAATSFCSRTLTNRHAPDLRGQCAGYLSVSYNAGNTGGTYTIGGEYISFAYTLYGNNATGGYRNVLFGDVPDNTFTADAAEPERRSEHSGLLRPHVHPGQRRPGELRRDQQDPGQLARGRPVPGRELQQHL